MFKLSKKDLSILIGNALDHYDTSLYGLLVPIIAPLFFPKYDYVVQLILGYSLFATSLITKPFGILLFSYIASKKGVIEALVYSLMGIALSVLLISCLPTYDTIGIAATILLIFARMLLDICAAGEGNIAKLYILEGKELHEAKRISYIYQVSNMVGVILASIAVTILTFAENPKEYWRLPFIFGSIICGIGIFLRKNVKEDASIPIVLPYHNIFSSLIGLKKEWRGILKVAIATSFGYVTYNIPFVFMNSFIPLVTNISFKEMMELNTILLIIDVIGLIIFGKYLKNFSHSKIMSFSSLALAISSIPLFWFINGSTIFYISFLRIWVVLTGVLFACYLNIWASHQFSPATKYYGVGFGSILGSSTLGKLTPTICLALWHYTGDSMAPAYFIVFISFLTFFAVRHNETIS